ncbi:MAG: hypothetical protein ABSA26_10380 [Thermoguttaceae bacterium]|jgi:hypothetical protein
MPEDTTTITVRQQQPATASAGPTEASRADELCSKATAWQDVVNKARESCRRGVDAVKELQRRRNKSGQ